MLFKTFLIAICSSTITVAEAPFVIFANVLSTPHTLATITDYYYNRLLDIVLNIIQTEKTLQMSKQKKIILLYGLSVTVYTYILYYFYPRKFAYCINKPAYSINNNYAFRNISLFVFFK